MTNNEVWQWSIVGLLILGAIVWAAIKALRLTKHGKSDAGCGSCDNSSSCKARELKDFSNVRSSQSQNCRDGQSAKN